MDAGSNLISVLRVTAGGGPVLVGQPVSSSGIKPVSVAVSLFGLVSAANSGAGGGIYTGSRLHFTPGPARRRTRQARSFPRPARSGRARGKLTRG